MHFCYKNRGSRGTTVNNIAIIYFHKPAVGSRVSLMPLLIPRANLPQPVKGVDSSPHENEEETLAQQEG